MSNPRDVMIAAVVENIGPVVGTPEYLARPGNVERLEARRLNAATSHIDAALSALEAAGWELNRKGTLDNVRAELTARAKEMQSARDTLIWVRDEMEDEGDRVYFGSTNHAEQFREVVEGMDEWSWHDIMRASRDTDYIGQGRIAAQKRDDLAMLVRRIIYRHSKELPLEELLAAADDYLARNQLNGSPLRDEASPENTNV